ncbi:MAG: hypothetical protein Kow0032_20200 [Methyloligellaceae bacterium]
MKRQCAFKNIDKNLQARASTLIDEFADGLKDRLKSYAPDVVSLEARLEKPKSKHRVSISLQLRLPTATLVARGEGHDLEVVLRDTLDELRARIDRHLERLRQSPRWKRKAQRERLKLAFEPSRDEREETRRETYFNLIEDHLDAVYNFVRRELTYLEASGEVPPGALNVEGLVDAVILAGLERFEQRPTEFSAGAWLFQLAVETVEAEAQRVRQILPQPALALEESPPEPAEEPTEKDQEFYEFYQPDEALRLEDLLSDETAASPEDEVSRRELQLVLQRAIADLPSRWRHALALRVFEGMQPEEAAWTLGMSEAELKNACEQALAFLGARLAQAGYLPEEIEKSLQAPRLAAMPRFAMSVGQITRLRAWVGEAQREEARASSA